MHGGFRTATIRAAQRVDEISDPLGSEGRRLVNQLIASGVDPIDAVDIVTEGLAELHEISSDSGQAAPLALFVITIVLCLGWIVGASLLAYFQAGGVR